MNTWCAIGESAARRHPLYGRGGWLVPLVACLPFSALLLSSEWLARVTDPRNPLFRPVDTDYTLYTMVVVSAWLVTATVICVRWLTKARRFRMESSTLLALAWTMFALLHFARLANVAPGTATARYTESIGYLLPGLLATLVWIAYLQRSRRVRVTFEHTVRGELAVPLQPAPLEPRPHEPVGEEAAPAESLLEAEPDAPAAKVAAQVSGSIEPESREPSPGEPSPGQPSRGEPATGQPGPGQPTSGEPSASELASGASVSHEPLLNEPLLNEPLLNEPLLNEPLLNAHELIAGAPPISAHAAADLVDPHAFRWRRYRNGLLNCSTREFFPNKRLRPTRQGIALPSSRYLWVDRFCIERFDRYEAPESGGQQQVGAERGIGEQASG